MTTWFTSDLHFGHRNIIRYCGRPFASTPEGVEAMNESLIRRWNAQVAPGDSVWILGDLAMGKRHETLPLVERLNGHKSLVPGNHDHCWAPGQRNEGKLDRALTLYRSVGLTIRPLEFNLSLGDRWVMVCHFPFEGDSHEEDRFTDLRPTNEGQWLLHGHVHDTWRQRARQINVGIDAWGGRLVAQEEILDMMAAGPNHLGPEPWGLDPLEATHV